MLHINIGETHFNYKIVKIGPYLCILWGGGACGKKNGGKKM